MKININESKGKEAIKGLIELTKEKKELKHKQIEKEVLKAVFEE